MSVAGKLGAYGVVLALSLGGGVALGLAARPIDTARAESPEHAPHRPDSPAARMGAGHSGHETPQEDQ